MDGDVGTLDAIALVVDLMEDDMVPIDDALMMDVLIVTANADESFTREV